MPRLTLRDQHVLRSMLADACEQNRIMCACKRDVQSRVARDVAYETTLAKIVPMGTLKPLRKPLFR